MSRNTSVVRVFTRASIVMLLVGAGVGQAQVVKFVGFDPGAGPTDPRPNSEIARINWTIAANQCAPVQTSRFECEPICWSDDTNGGALGPSPAASTTGVFGPLTINIAAPVSNHQCTSTTLQRTMTLPPLAAGSLPRGYNTSTPPGLGNHLELLSWYDCTSCTYTITFSIPIMAFGMYVTGEGIGDLNIGFSDDQSAYIVDMPDTPGARWVSFVDCCHPIRQVFLNFNVTAPSSTIQPHVSLDDLSWVFYKSCGSCSPDFDDDGFLTGDDFDAFVAAFEIGDISADYDADGFVSGEDFDAYVIDFESGC